MTLVAESLVRAIEVWEPNDDQSSLTVSSGIYGDLKTRWTGEEGEVNSALVKMSSMLHYYSSDRARRELNYGTRPIEDTVRHAWEWFKEFRYV